MPAKTLLLVWTGLGIGWWTLARSLVASASAKTHPAQSIDAALTPRSLTVFKPLPKLREEGMAVEEPGLESFISQLAASDEMLLGVHEADREAVAPFLARMHQRHPAGAARIKVIYRTPSSELANPKIVWQRLLAPEAGGELWLWSDADITAPSGFLRRARAEYEKSGAARMTFPYIVR